MASGFGLLPREGTVQVRRPRTGIAHKTIQPKRPPERAQITQDGSLYGLLRFPWSFSWVPLVVFGLDELQKDTSCRSTVGSLVAASRLVTYGPDEKKTLHRPNGPNETVHTLFTDTVPSRLTSLNYTSSSLMTGSCTHALAVALHFC